MGTSPAAVEAIAGPMTKATILNMRFGKQVCGTLWWHKLPNNIHLVGSCESAAEKFLELFN
jgi:hypothetical protein